MAGYLGSVPVPQATQHRESFTATEGQTSFATAGYTPQFVDVYLNGSHLSPADFTASNGSDVVLGVAASADDVCDIISYTPFEVADQTFTGTTTMTGAISLNDGTDNFNIGVTTNKLTIKSTTSDGSDDTSILIDAGSGGESSSRGGYIEVHGNETSAEAGKVIYQMGSVSGSTHEFRKAGGNNAVIINSDGVVTMPLQPAFLVHPTSTQSNIAINGIVTVVFGTERYDIGGNFASNTFTAPVTGKYQLNVEIRIDTIDTAATYYHLYLITSNKSYFNIVDPNFTADLAYMSLSTSVLADMDKDDTAFVGIYQAAGTSQSDIQPDSNFSGILVA